MTHKLLTLIFTAMVLAMCPAAAQNLKFDIVKFELNQLDGTASNAQYRKVDGSGNLYAVIKVRSTDGDEGLGEFMFNFNSLKSIVEDKGDELWVYVQKNAKIVTISREGYTPLRNFDLKMTLQAGKTYNMEITYDRVEKVVKKELRMQMLSFKLTPTVEGAMVMYKEQGTDNDELFGQTNKQGMVSKNLKFGTYEYKILANNYFATEGIVKLNNSDEVYTENITLKPNFSTITLSTNEGADIYVNNELKGRGKWTGALKAGEYVVECKQEGHRPTSQGIIVEINADKSIELQRPTPITGYVSVISDPSGATVLIDGKERGKTPCNIKDVLVGYRRVALSMSGYATASTSIEVKEGEVANINLTLKNTATSNTSAAKANTTTTTTSENGEENKKVDDGEISATTTNNTTTDNTTTKATTSQKPVDPELEKIFQKGLKAYNRKSYDIAVKHFTKAAKQGHSDAQFYLGKCYFNGEGVGPNTINALRSEALWWFKKAVEQGNVAAQCALGRCYLRGYGCEVNKAEGIRWIEKSAEQGYAYAQFTLGECYYNGNGVEFNRTEAVKWYRKAAEQGEVNGQCYLGCCYMYGKGVTKDKAEAIKWLSKAAEQGNNLAIIELNNYKYYKRD